jgi:transposase
MRPYTKLLILNRITQSARKNKESGAKAMAKTSFEAIHMPACGLDIHKDVIEATVIDENGEKHRKTVNTMRKSLFALKDWIMSLGCLNVLMESTSVYWIPIYEILETVRGMDVGVGNARNMKQVPGRPKTDKSDSDWIARLCMVGLVLKSFVVGRKYREMREYTRYYKKLVQEKARQINRIEKLLQINGFKLSSVLSNITGASGMRLLRKLRDNGGVTLHDVYEALDSRVRKTPEEIESAINGQMKVTSRLLLGKMLKKLEACETDLEEIYAMMLKNAGGHQAYIHLLDSIPSINELSALYIIAEISTDMSSFKTSGHITAWAGLAPKDNESAGKLKSSKTQRANIYIKSVLIECAWAAVRARDTRLSNWYWANVKRLGERKAITAVARKLLVYIYAMLKSGELYDGSLDAADTLKRKAEKLESARKIVEHRPNKTSAQKRIINEQAVSEAANPVQTENTGTVITGNAGSGPALPKKRGRPRKTPVVSNAGVSETTGQTPGSSVITNAASDNAAIQTPPKKRGRPRKLDVANILAINQNA